MIDYMKIAETAHNINILYCEGMGDTIRISWEASGNAFKASVWEAVKSVAENPGVAPEACHDHWMVNKKKMGWTLGLCLSYEAKTHPLLIPYAELPLCQRIKDILFMSVVRGLVSAYEESDDNTEDSA